MVNQNFTEGNSKEKKEVDFNVDGEPLKFKEFVKMRVLHQELDIILDYDRLLKRSGYIV